MTSVRRALVAVSAVAALSGAFLAGRATRPEAGAAAQLAVVGAPRMFPKAGPDRLLQPSEARPGGAETPEEEEDAPDPLPGHSPTALLETMSLPLFNEDGMLNEQFARQLRLTPDEYRRMNQSLSETREEIMRIRSENIEMRQESDSQLFVKIPSFREEGEAVQAALEADLRGQLGDDRFASFQLMAEEAMNNEYYAFGKALQTISVKAYTSENTGQSRLRIVDEIHVPQDDGVKFIIERKGNYDTLPEAYAPYFDVVGAESR